MTSYDHLFTLPCYSQSQTEKENILVPILKALSVFHMKECLPYQRFIQSNSNYKPIHEITKINEIPTLAVRLFKMFELLSIPKDEIFKTLTSSGTTGQSVSKIFLNQEVAKYQSTALVKILQSFIGVNRLPMLIVDTPSITQAQNAFSARAAGIRGLATFGRQHTYLLDDQMNLNEAHLIRFLQQYEGQPILIFGFTFMVWEYFYQKIKHLSHKIDLSQAILIHSGGWKKMIDRAVNNETFKKSFYETTGLKKIHNFYGMVEQVGSIFMECEEGYLHTPLFADIVTKDLKTNTPMPLGKEGVIEVFSILPKSYPGHALLTEDLGTIWGVDDCPCGRKGQYFTVSGRIPTAEARGCSDTHTETHQQPVL